MLTDARPVVAFLALLGACVWVGGFVVIVLVTRIVRAQLEPAGQVTFFRALGRRYLVVGLSALIVAFAAGGVLLADRDWDTMSTVTVAVAATLVAAVAAGVVQARGMTRLRARAVREPGDAALAARVRRGAAVATGLRALIGLQSLELLALAAVLSA